MNALEYWPAPEGLLPQGDCFTWNPALLWLTVTGDAVIALSYLSIPLALTAYLFRKGPALRTDRVVLALFSLFIFAGGITHVMDIVTVWWPAYWISAFAKLVTAVVWAGLAFVLWKWIPRFVRLPTIGRLALITFNREEEIAERLRIEASLLDAQSNLSATLSALGAALISVDRDGRVVHMNQLAEIITGWTRDQAHGQALWQVWKQEGLNVDELARHPLEVMTEPGPCADTAWRVTAIARTGERRAVELSASLTRDRKGQMRGMTLVFRDLTPMDKAVEDSNRLAAIAQWADEAIIGLSVNGTIQDWNPAAQTLFGHTADEAIGQDMSMVLPNELSLITEQRERLDRVAAGKTVPAFETVGVHKSGHHLDEEIVMAPIADATGTVVAASMIVRNISDRKNEAKARDAAERLAADNRQMIEAARMKNACLASMSHELRTPLNAIIGFADLLHAGVVSGDRERQQEFLGYIRSSACHLLQLINGILDLSKAEFGRREFVPEPLDLPRLMQKQGCDVRMCSEPGKGSAFSTVLPRKAVKASLPARVPGRALAVVTTGSGEERVRRLLTQAGLEVDVFNRYEQAQEQLLLQSYQAVCLDLTPGDEAVLDLLARLRHSPLNREASVVALTVAAPNGKMGGFVVADVLTKPAAPSALQALVTRVKPKERRGPRVLVVDDDTAALRCAREMLQSMGAEVLCVESGFDALDALEGFEPDAMVLDLMMPEMDGFTVLQRLRGLARWRALPVFVWTGMALSEHEHARLKRSARAVLNKGQDLELLWELLENVPLTLPATGTT
ncbi:MAG TPA: PAS domain S-box protein [Burkholderiaceae bacterium]|nr:PAS domain S-box protein [Burkholderiaceae bacterium]